MNFIRENFLIFNNRYNRSVSVPNLSINKLIIFHFMKIEILYVYNLNFHKMNTSSTLFLSLSLTLTLVSLGQMSIYERMFIFLLSFSILYFNRVF
jgi:hypothetical protein